MAEKTEAEALAEMKDAATLHQIEGSFFGVAPKGYGVVGLEEYQAAPARIKSCKTVTDTKGMAEYMNRFGGADGTILTVDTDGARIQAEVDFHRPGEPSHNDHMVTFVARKDHRYQAWENFSDQWRSQSSVGEFLEDRAIDVIMPSAADIMDIVMNFDALKRVSFKQSTRLHDGQRQFTYSEENEQRGNVTLPETMTILVPVFEWMEPQSVKIRIRFRIEDGKLLFSFLIAEQQDLEAEAFGRCEDALLTGLDFNPLVLRA